MAEGREIKFLVAEFQVLCERMGGLEEKDVVVPFLEDIWGDGGHVDPMFPTLVARDDVAIAMGEFFGFGFVPLHPEPVTKI